MRRIVLAGGLLALAGPATAVIAQERSTLTMGLESVLEHFRDRHAADFR